MGQETASWTRLRAVELSGDASAVEGPLAGYYNETYVIALPDGFSGGARWKCREPRRAVLWFDRRCFASEDELLAALAGRVECVPEMIGVGTATLQRFIDGRTLGAGHRRGTAIPGSCVDELVHTFRQLAAITGGTLRVERRCQREDRPEEGDSAGFLERLVCFVEERVYQENLDSFGALFRSLGIDDDAFKYLRKSVAGLAPRPFCLLHCDLHRENLIVDREGRLWVIDWELAMLGDPLYDLATHLYLMRYPGWQAHQVTARWAATVEAVRTGMSRGAAEDLPVILAFKRAQSVFTDVIRQALTLRSDALSVVRAAGQLRQVLERGAEPLGMASVPSRRQIAASLAAWQRASAAGAAA
ncbi:aminoglycoside phosphotransferase family protein [Streptomyces sp. HD]|uniref:aminoglycoside phosphotransferase family protein n=1 Tax=Streptomyces sp. HD TaxID=3020892 RepID=UPI0023307D52|nr:aminoglycoside phosphotransferase family protein [Streptomyces sp. HD]MDC0770236.1 aminoglycoside phosphotransferase family protein [Streptomyces sp. HD]